MDSKTIGFIGLGLMGGSLAKGIRKKHPTWQIIAFDRCKESLKRALEEGVITQAASEVGKAFSSCDFIFLCAPVAVSVQYLKKLKPFLKEGTILTDVGSTKEMIMKEARALCLEPFFIGGHPMAGSEQSGYEHSTDHLVENAYYVLTPFPDTPKEALSLLEGLMKELGALPLILDAKEHDYIVAAVSHLPHLIAAALVNLVKDADSPEGTMGQIAAGGFKDITRIASSSPVMWEQVCMANRENIASVLKDYLASMNQILKEVEKGEGDAIYRLFDTSRAYRSSMPDKSLGPIKKQYAIYCDIVDESGAIATLATILASHQISIKNIGVLHSREFEEGVLKVEFYDEPSSKQAAELLTRHQYRLFER